MALPQLKTPEYELVLPSTQEKIKYRPFLVREQKILMLAQESGEDTQMAAAMGDIVKNCTFEKVDPSMAPMFDVEYLFLQIRAKAVGETVEVNITCPDDGETKVAKKIKIDDINVQQSLEHSREVDLGNEIKVIFRYPLLSDVVGMMSGTTELEQVFFMLKNCITEIHYGEDIYNRIDITDEELDTFVDQMSSDQFEKVTDFFNTMPKLRHVVDVTNPKTKVKSEVLLEGLESFLD